MIKYKPIVNLAVGLQNGTWQNVIYEFKPQYSNSVSPNERNRFQNAAIRRANADERIARLNPSYVTMLSLNFEEIEVDDSEREYWVTIVGKRKASARVRVSASSPEEAEEMAKVSISAICGSDDENWPEIEDNFGVFEVLPQQHLVEDLTISNVEEYIPDIEVDYDDDDDDDDYDDDNFLDTDFDDRY